MGSGWHRWSAVSVRVTVAVAVVAEVSAGTRNAIEATGADAGADVVGDAIHVHLTKVIAVGGHDPVWSTQHHATPLINIIPQLQAGRQTQKTFYAASTLTLCTIV